MNIFKRLFNIGTAEAHSAIDKLEDPIKLTQQGIRDLKKDLDKSLHALAEVKALAIRSKRDALTNNHKAKDYEQKAMLLLQKAQKGDLEMQEADRLAGEALTKKEDCMKEASRAEVEREKFDKSVAQLDGNIKGLKSQISKYENELRTLTARVRVSNATKNINKQMAQIDASSTVSLLERMKEKVDQDEALAESYGEIAGESKSLDDELDQALEGSSSASADLEALKAKMGISGKENEKDS